MRKLKKKLILILILIIILIILSIYAITTLVYNYQYNKEQEEANVEIEETYEKYMEGKILPKGAFYLLRKYEGDYNVYDFYSQLYLFANNLVSFQNDIKSLDENSLKNYYDENLDSLKNNFCIVDYDSYITMTTYLKSLKSLGDYEECEVSDNVIERSESYEFNMEFTYSNMEENLNFKVNFYKNGKEDMPCALFTPIVNN